jgi:hypothetical protein
VLLLSGDEQATLHRVTHTGDEVDAQLLLC